MDVADAGFEGYPQGLEAAGLVIEAEIDARRMARDDGNMDAVGKDNNTERSGQGVGHSLKLACSSARASTVGRQGEERVGKKAVIHAPKASRPSQRSIGSHRESVSSFQKPSSI